jgi:hypothetical protein
MEAHAGTVPGRRGGGHLEAERSEPRTRLVVDGCVAGLAGGVALAAPIVIWDWAHDGHKALELPMAATAWLFGLEHFSHDQNLWGPIVIGTVLLALAAAINGVVYAGLASRVLGLRSLVSGVLAGAAWGFVSFMFFWYMLLPIARDGAPFKATAADPDLFVAANWVWILGFTLFGLVTGAAFAAIHRRGLVESRERSTREEPLGSTLRYAS